MLRGTGLALMCIVLNSALWAADLIPSSAPRGAHVIVSGEGLDATSVSVAFTDSGGGTARAAIVARAAAFVEAVVPSSAETGRVTVTANGATIGSFAFTLLPDPPLALVATIVASQHAHDVFDQPSAVVQTPNGALYVADSQHDQIKVFAVDGRLLSAIGGFKHPQGLAFGAGLVYIADTGNNAIRRLTAEGTLSTFVGPEAGLKQPAGIAIDASGNLYVADSGNGQIRMISALGVVSAVAGGVQQGFADGPAADALFKQPLGIAIDSEGALYVADSGNNRIRRVANGIVSTVAGTGHGALFDGAANVAEFKQPAGIAVDEGGNIFVADAGNHAIRKISGGVVSTIAGNGNPGYADGAPPASLFKSPEGLFALGAVIVADSSNDALRAIYSAPRTTAIYPRSGAEAGGSVVRIFGTGFVPGATQVSFAGSAAISVAFVASTEILATVPPGRGSAVDVKVSTPAGDATLSGAYAYLPPPSISTIEPHKGKLAGGDVVTITGANFSDEMTVTIGGAAASNAVVISSSSMTATTPAGPAGGADVTVTTNGGAATKLNAFTYLAPPVITNFAPLQGGGGTAVSISGVNFDLEVSGNQVSFGSLPATIATASATQLVTTVPGGAITGKITVTTAGGSTQSARDFEVATFSGLRITSPATTIDVGSSIQLNAIAVLLDGGAVDVTSKASWTSNNDSVRVTSTGTVSGAAAGFADITASLGGLTTTTRITANAVLSPPDPSTLAPKSDPTIVPMFTDEIRFLYTGPNAIQTSVAPNAIADNRAAVVRGSIHSAMGTPLPGVRITALKHPELGQTLTRRDGVFDFVINGGGTVVLRFEKAGHIESQRSVTLQWNQQTTLQDVVLLGYDSRVTEVTSGAPQTQIARGALVNDRDGARQTTIIFPGATAAVLSFPDGTTRPASTLHVRATEFSVGSDGPHAMPAALPRNSAYTYCVELSADEAVAAGADIRFSQSVPLYVDNFLGFSVGSVVPVGYYDRHSGAWVPSDNGVVVKILSIANGFANVDVNGDGIADKIDDAERQALASQYAAGKTLWRVPITHFSSWDANWGEVDPGNRLTPSQPQPATTPAPSSRDGSGCTIANSIVNCYSANVYESIPIVGTPYELEYDSSRVSPAQNSMTISLSGATFPELLKRIDLTINIAGRSESRSFPPQANLHYDFSWDGLDVYGRSASGARDAGVALSYVYDSNYVSALASGRAWNLGGLQPANVRGRDELTFTQLFTVRLGHFRAGNAGFGGWTFSPQHFYDGRSGTIYEDGAGQRSGDPAQTRQLAVSTYAGSTQVGFSGDGGPATQAALRAFNFIAAGPDGSLYIADSHDFGCFPNGACGSAYSRIRRVDPQTHTIDTIAGNGQIGFMADGAFALGSPIAAQQIAVGPDGSVYFTDLFRVRRIVDGLLTTIAGDGNAGSNAMPDDGATATQVAITPRAIVVDSCGSVYIALISGIIRVSQDGLVSKYSPFPFVAGLAVGPRDQLYATDTFGVYEIGPNGSRLVGGLSRGTSGGDLRDGDVATSGALSVPSALAVGSDGTILVSETGRAPRIRAISGDGIATTLIGNGSFPNFALPADGLLARAAPVGPWGIAAAPDGSVYFLDQQLIIVRRAAGVFPAAQRGVTAIPSREGSTAFVFQNGRHTSTVDTLTGVTLLNLGYDPNGYLQSLTDFDNNEVRIERVSDGSATAIVAPGGQRTSLQIANGCLISIVNPANEEVAVTYNNDGLLSDLVDPRKGHHRVTYDAHGTVTRDEGPDGSYFTLAKSGSGQNYSVTRTTAEGLNHVYTVGLASNTAATRQHNAPDGTFTKYAFAAATTTSISSDGSAQSITDSPDPRFGMTSPFLGSGTFSGGGQTATLSLSRSVTPDATTPFAVSLFKEKLVLNGHTWANSYDATSREIRVTSPAGRVTSSILDEKGRLSTIVEPSMTPIAFSYNPSGQLATISQGSRTLTYGYDDKHRLTSITNPLGGITRFDHDLAGRITSQMLPGGRVVAFTYDASGNLTSLAPPGRAPNLFSYTAADLPSALTGWRYDYDSDRKLTLITKPDRKTISFTYDAGGRLAAMNTSRGSYRYSYDTTGQLSEIAAPDGGILTHTYSGPLLSSVAWTGTTAGSVSYGYDNNFRIVSETAAGTAAAFTYDADGFLTGAGAMTFKRDSENGLLSDSALGAVNDGWIYDGFGEPLTYMAAAAGNPLLHQRFTRNDAGQILQKSEAVLGENHTYDYTYDAAGRLIGVMRDGATTASYAYDINGNRLPGTYDEQDRMLAFGAATYTYTPNGERAAKSEPGHATSFTYDDSRNLTGVSLGTGQTIEYVVDGRSRRVGKKIDGVLVRQWLYSDAIRIVAELDGKGDLISRFVYGSRPNVPEYMIRGGATYRILSDHLGSPRLVAETTTGSVAQWLAYDAFGVVTTDTNPGFQPFGFAGGLYDGDTQLVHFGARDYDAGAGRWLVPDPIGFLGLDTNLYAYALSDPVNFIDPTGLTIERCFRPFTSTRSRILSAIAVANHPLLLLLQPPVPGVRAFLGHEYLYDTETGLSESYDPNEDEQESGKGICYKIPEPLGRCVWKNFRRVAGPTHNYNLLRHNCQLTVNDTVQACREELRSQSGRSRQSHE